MPGTITFRPIEANLTHNTDILTKMNPYCSFIVGGQKFNSDVCKKGGKHPHWNDAISIPTGNESLAIVELMDQDRLTKDDIIGGCSINLSEIQAQGPSRNWYPLFYKNKPAGEILLETSFSGSGFGQQGFAQQGFSQQSYTGASTLGNEALLAQQSGLIAGQTGFASGQQAFSSVEQTRLSGAMAPATTEFIREERIIEEAPRKVFTEQHQSVAPHTFMKNVEVTETVPVQKQIEVMEARKVLKDVEYTQAVPVMKQIEVVEPQVVMKEVEVIEPRVVTKTIEVVENVPVKRQVEVVEMKHLTKEVETFEPQTFHKQVEITEQVPVLKSVTVSEPVTVTKAVEFVEPVITTQTVTKEILEPVVVNQRITQEVGPASVIGMHQETHIHTGERIQLSEQELLLREQQRLAKQQIGGSQTTTFSEQELLLREQQRLAKQQIGGTQTTTFTETRTDKRYL